MARIPQFLKSGIVSEAKARRVAQVVCFAAALAVLVIGIRRFTVVAVTEFELLLGIFAVFAVSLLLVVAGVLVGPRDGN